MNEREWLSELCPFCGHLVLPARSPWLFERHDIHGRRDGGASICVGSRNRFTLDLLGLRDIEPELMPPSLGLGRPVRASHGMVR